MADIKLCNLDDRIADVLRTRAKHRGISLAEEIRRSLSASVESDMAAFARRGRTRRDCRARTRRRGRQRHDHA